ncbi:MAG: TetR/AcrR family transcriptional regulator [Hyphomicrobium sp.]|nr:TetR/AcrR family transcriptional regulator [Hyphomicrobium sp.]
MHKLKMEVKRNPGRPRSFDPDEALAHAMRVFWANGYGNTTFKMLEDATGMHAQSLRYVFGDKHSLFLAVLRHYSKTRVDRVVQCLNDRQRTAFAAIQSALALWLEDADREIDQGCLMVNTTGELGREDRAIAEIIEQADRKLVAAFSEAIRAAQKSGEISTYADPKALARMIVTLGDGAMLHSRAKGSSRSAKLAFGALTSMLAR